MDMVTVFTKLINQFAIHFLSIKELLSSLLITEVCSSYLSLVGMSFLFTKYSFSHYVDLVTKIEQSSCSFLTKFISENQSTFHRQPEISQHLT